MCVTSREYADSIHVRASAEDVYALVSDVTRTGEWSPVCQGCEWEQDPSAGISPGMSFIGHNASNGREWSTRSVVTAADGARFAWSVGPGLVEWSYQIEAGERAGTCTLTETWEFTEAGQNFFRDHYAEQAESRMEQRTAEALAGIPVTLAAIATLAEGDRSD